ncbi:MAG TPA: hypothetical protein PK613_22455 [Anaerolineaceae bacterium]|nr:hypothetical protein [Anaerolineaceae bacterium]
MGFQQSKLKNAPSAIFPYLAVIGHETLLTKSQAGNSFQDLALGFEGVNLGADLWAGAISPSDVGNYVRENFNPLSQTAVNWSCHAETFFSFLWALGY